MPDMVIIVPFDGNNCSDLITHRRTAWIFIGQSNEPWYPLRSAFAKNDANFWALTSCGPGIWKWTHWVEVDWSRSKTSELQAKASRVFHQVDPQLGAYFDLMISEGLLDSGQSQKQSARRLLHGVCRGQAPFIFMNAVGVHDDVQTVLHEAGHAFHAFERTALPYYQQRHVGMEFSEVASMAMELLAAPYLAEQREGSIARADAARARAEHLECERSFLGRTWPSWMRFSIGSTRMRLMP